MAIWTDISKHDTNKRILQYDDMGVISAWGWNNGDDYGLVRFSLKNDSVFEGIGTYTLTNNSTIQFSIYKNFDGNTLSEKLYDSDEYKCIFPGYYKFPVTKEISFPNDQDIYVKVKYDNPEKLTPIPIECDLENYALTYTTCEVFWVSDDGHDNTWIPWGDYTGYFQNINVKGYTCLKNSPPQTNKKAVSVYPNPFNQETSIAFDLPVYSHVSLNIYNSKGQLVKTLVNENRLSGKNRVIWNGKNNNDENVASGLYFARIQNKFANSVEKFVLIK
jgi:hypothetical protein